jgi:3-phosphoshikimate 1-carboxyvinyltransferase
VLSENKNKKFSKKSALLFNLKDYPDLFPALAITCAAKKIKCTFKNVAHLQHKESARATVFKSLVEQLGGKVTLTKNSFSIDSYSLTNSKSLEWFYTYNDHRVAMALAPLAAIYHSVKIHESDVVKKSFPGFWKEFSRG